MTKLYWLTQFNRKCSFSGTISSVSWGNVALSCMHIDSIGMAAAVVFRAKRVVSVICSKVFSWLDRLLHTTCNLYNCPWMLEEVKIKNKTINHTPRPESSSLICLQLSAEDVYSTNSSNAAWKSEGSCEEYHAAFSSYWNPNIIKHEMQCFISEKRVAYQAWNTVFHPWEDSWKYNTLRSIFDEHRGVSYGDETLGRMLDITSQTKWF